ncbi:hypothetical protein DdX_12673 [Ditylenchus destructor]|uniref:Uncharacterized protein n=1 Tax=Ditylenchus destructor TaxID=166010 RepID=A0AAD4MU87_9BILA|nr:hypothetical protein DdX_12673 [Ditylenchus destructor]
MRLKIGHESHSPATIYQVSLSAAARQFHRPKALLLSRVNLATKLLLLLVAVVTVREEPGPYTAFLYKAQFLVDAGTGYYSGVKPISALRRVDLFS